MKLKLAHLLFLFILLICLQNSVHVLGASGFVKYPQNPIFSEDPNNWDSYHVQNPSIIKLNDGYDMWYDANGGSGWRIGYANSTNGLSNWTRTTQPVIPPGSIDGWEKETADPFVIYDQPNSIYRMWFTSINTDHWQSGEDRFRTRYATSTDGINWTILGWVLTGTSGSWDGGGTARGRSIIYKDGIYHMWYSATNTNDLGSNPYWRIGYATSVDGITWTKENQGNPVISPGEKWELNNVSYPNVIYTNGSYHMWYGAGAADVTSQIVYAYSKDGINWIKPPELNPVLIPGPSTWDSFNVVSPFMLIDNDLLKMWYSGYFYDHWQIGYATASADWLPKVTPTATPTPTPLPPPTKQVIVIPGMTASWNLSDLIQCKTNPGNTWSLIPVVATGVYNPILQRLTKDGWTGLTFTYDWRKRVSENAQLLKSFIDSHVKPGEKVDVVAHSMGGLLARSYIEQEGTNNKIDKLITVGTPHKGSIDAYPTWSAGVIPQGNDIMWRFYVMAIEKFCASKTQNYREAIQQFFPSIQDILPTFDYLIDNQTNKIKPVQSMAAKNTWLLNSTFGPPYSGVTVGTLSGNNYETGLAFHVINPTPQDVNAGNWIDGKPVQTDTTTDGDDRVLVSSSTLSNATNLGPIDVDHMHLISSPDGINKIMDFLNGPKLAQAALLATPLTKTTPKPHKQEQPAPTSGLFIIGYPGNLWVIDPFGKFYKDADGLVSIMDPKPGLYKLVFWPKERESRLIVAQMLSDNRNFWKEYTFKTRLPRFHIPQIHVLKFDDRHPKEDILH